MSNKRITELVPINSATIESNDLVAIADVSIPETKKATMATLANWVAYSASLSVDTASYSGTSSYLLYGGYPNGTASFAISSSWAYLAYSASFVISSSHAKTASYALTCSFFDGTISGAFSVTSADTASFLRYQGWPNGTASFALSSSRSERVDTASFVSWFGGQVDNGTVYRSISSSYAGTASVFLLGGTIVASSASWASSSYTSSISNTASYLYWNGQDTGTASFAFNTPNAINAQTASIATRLPPSNYVLYGPYTGSTSVNLNYSESFIGLTGRIRVVPWPGNSTAQTMFSVVGSVIVPFTGSTFTDSYISMSLVATGSNATIELDRQHFYFRTNNAGTETGSMKISFTMQGYSASLSGSYRLAIGASGCELDTTRTTTWKIESRAYNLTVT